MSYQLDATTASAKIPVPAAIFKCAQTPLAETVVQPPPATCRLCGARLAIPLGQPGLEHLEQCSACGLVYVRNFPAAEDVHSIYDESYYRNTASHVVGYEDYEADQANIVNTARRRLKFIAKRHPEPGRLLDVGCALGFFMEAASEAGWHATGIDISHYASTAASERTGQPVHCGELEHAGFADKSFDVVTLWDVVEHMADPLTQLQECHRILTDDGLLVLSTPDIGSLVAKITGPRWMGFKLADEHLFYFSLATVANLLDRAGFQIVENSHVGKYVNLEFFVKRLGLYTPRLAAALRPVVRGTRLGRLSVYVNPNDILFVAAAKRPSNSPQVR